MLNKEKFNDEIIEIATTGEGIAKVDGNLCRCGDIECNDCDFVPYKNNDVDCDVSIPEWANSEYVEEVDWNNVEEGTIIWVRNYEDCDWVKRMFAFKIEKGFACICLGEEMKAFPRCIVWKYARLDNPYEEKQNE